MTQLTFTITIMNAEQSSRSLNKSMHVEQQCFVENIPEYALLHLVTLSKSK